MSRRRPTSVSASRRSISDVRLHARVHVVVEHRLEAARAGQPGRCANAVEVDFAVARAPVAEHRLRVEAVEQVEGGLERGVVAVAEAQFDERAGQHQAPQREPVAQLLAPAEIPGWAELRALVARSGDRVEHAIRPRNVGQDAHSQLERAVADGRVCEPDHGLTSGTRGSFSIPSHAGRTQASSGSSAAAIERRSPASALR